VAWRLRTAPGYDRTHSGTAPTYRVGVTAGRKVGIRSGMAATHSSGTGGFDHVAGSEYWAVNVGTRPGLGHGSLERLDDGLCAAGDPPERPT
jgi:hypothetical protein